MEELSATMSLRARLQLRLNATNASIPELASSSSSKILTSCYAKLFEDDSCESSSEDEFRIDDFKNKTPNLKAANMIDLTSNHRLSPNECIDLVSPPLNLKRKMSIKHRENSREAVGGPVTSNSNSSNSSSNSNGNNNSGNGSGNGDSYWSKKLRELSKRLKIMEQNESGSDLFFSQQAEHSSKTCESALTRRMHLITAGGDDEADEDILDGPQILSQIPAVESQDENIVVISEIEPEKATKKSKKKTVKAHSIPNEIPTNSLVESHESVLPETEPESSEMRITTSCEDWLVVLVIDRREKDYLFLQSTLLSLGVPCVISSLSLGDFLWVAQPKECDGIGNGKNCAVLDCIVERKTVADLASSIVDGRYLEQKMRLRDCTVKSKVYIVEGLSLSTNIPRCSHVNSAAIKSAMVATSVDFGVNVIRARGLDHTVNILTHLHKRVLQQFERNYQSRQEYLFHRLSDFQRDHGKRSARTSGDLLLHQLKQIPGCSTAIALTLQRKFTTFAAMANWMINTPTEDAVREIAIMRKDGGGQLIGQKVAQEVCDVFQKYY